MVTTNGPNGPGVTSLKCESTSDRDGVRTARETEAHNVFLSSGVQASRPPGSTSQPLKSLCSTLVPRVSFTRSGTTVISSCAKPLKKFNVSLLGTNVTVGLPEILSLLNR